MNIRPFAIFQPSESVHAHHRAQDFLRAARDLGAEPIGQLMVWPHLSWRSDEDLRFQLKPFSEDGRLIVGVLVSPDL